MVSEEKLANPKGGRRKKQENPRLPVLTPRQKQFALEYLIDRNATAAYKRAGYSKGAAQSAACEVISKPHVKAEINRLMKLQVDATMIDANYVLQRHHDIDQLDILDIMDEEMTEFKPLSKWPRNWRISINALDINRIVKYDKEGKGSIESIIEKIKWPDKVRNLELLGKHTKVMAYIPEENTGDAIPISKIVVEVIGANDID